MIVLRKHRRSNEERRKLKPDFITLGLKDKLGEGVASSYPGIKKTRQGLEDAELPPTD